MEKGVPIKVILPKRIAEIVESAAEMGIFSSSSDLGKTAIIKYLDDMHFLDLLKNTVAAHRIDK